MENKPVKQPIFCEKIESVTISAMLDERKKREIMPVAIRVNYQRERWYYGTGIYLSVEQYQKIVKANSRRNTGDNVDTKARIKEVFDKVVEYVKVLVRKGTFSLEELKFSIGKGTVNSNISLYEYWIKFGESKTATKTQEQYKQAANSFYLAIGCKLIKDCINGKKYILQGNKLNLKPNELHAGHIQMWDAYMDERSLSLSTKSIYKRALRAVLNGLKSDGLIGEVVKMKITSGVRRQDDFLTVKEIMLLNGYSGEYRESVDWWLILYMCNGSNLRDLALLKWNRDFANNELSYIRSKTAHKTPSKVYIPIIPQLKELLDKYATQPKDGELVFPQILLNAKSGIQIDNRVHDFNASIRVGMSKVCDNLGIKMATASTARNSYITTLSWHSVSDAFIDAMVGHTDSKNVLRGYQGIISPKKRLEQNMKLFIDPEME